MELEGNELPAKRNGYLTFGGLNNRSKVNEPTLRLWTRVLREFPDSQLLLLSAPGSCRAQTLELLKRHGIAPQRVEFVGPFPHAAYLSEYHRLDVVLDTYPYHGHTTSLDALWMGVPVVSLCGQRAVSRAGWSQMKNLGLSELAAQTEEEFVRSAVDLAGNLPGLAELRTRLRRRMEASVLMDASYLTRQIQAAYRAMWRCWCAQPNSA